MENTVKQMLQKGKQAIGVFYTLGSTVAAECIGLSGFDFFVADTEHATLDVESVLPAILATENRRIAPFVRIKDASRPSVLKMLDIGAAGLIVPYIQNLREVKSLVEFAKYAPVGNRGYGIVRANGYGFAPFAQPVADYFALSNEATLLIPQCETAGCLADIEAIAAVEGVDGIFVGPYDLSVALGVAGQMDAPELMDAIVKVQRVCKEAGKFSFIFAGNLETAATYLHMGYDAVTCSVDSVIMTNAMQQIVQQLRR